MRSSSRVRNYGSVLYFWVSGCVVMLRRKDSPRYREVHEYFLVSHYTHLPNWKTLLLEVINETGSRRRLLMGLRTLSNSGLVLFLKSWNNELLRMSDGVECHSLPILWPNKYYIMSTSPIVVSLFVWKKLLKGILNLMDNFIFLINICSQSFVSSERRSVLRSRSPYGSSTIIIVTRVWTFREDQRVSASRVFKSALNIPG